MFTRISFGGLFVSCCGRWLLVGVCAAVGLLCWLWCFVFDDLWVWLVSGGFAGLYGFAVNSVVNAFLCDLYIYLILCSRCVVGFGLGVVDCWRFVLVICFDFESVCRRLFGCGLLNAW